MIPSILSFFTANRSAFGVGAVVLAVGGAGLWYGSARYDAGMAEGKNTGIEIGINQGRSQALQEYATRRLEAQQETVRNATKIHTNIDRLPDDDVSDRLRDNWSRSLRSNGRVPLGSPHLSEPVHITRPEPVRYPEREHR